MEGHASRLSAEAVRFRWGHQSQNIPHQKEPIRVFLTLCISNQSIYCKNTKWYRDCLQSTAKNCNPNQSYMYIPSTLKLCVQWNNKSWFKSRVIIFTFQVFWMKKHSKLTWKFRIKILFYLIYRLIWPETSTFFVCPNDFGEHLFFKFL